VRYSTGDRSAAQLAASRRKWVARFWGRVERITESGCWIWMGATSCGYGHVRILKELKLAHRVSYEIHRGPIPGGLELDHLCRVRCCVNPAHLEPVTSVVNTARGKLAEVTRARYARITHCPRGHAYAEPNLRYAPNGARYCLACRNILAAKYREKRRAVCRV